jgi:hypothetical protein
MALNNAMRKASELWSMVRVKPRQIENPSLPACRLIASVELHPH